MEREAGKLTRGTWPAAHQAFFVGQHWHAGAAACRLAKRWIRCIVDSRGSILLYGMECGLGSTESLLTKNYKMIMWPWWSGRHLICANLCQLLTVINFPPFHRILPTVFNIVSFSVNKMSTFFARQHEDRSSRTKHKLNKMFALGRQQCKTSQELRMLSPSLFIQGSQCKC